MIKVIGLTGVKGSGKSTAAKIIQEIYPNFIEKALASKLKNVCSKVLNIPRENFDISNLKEIDLENFIHFNEEQLINILNHFNREYDIDKHIKPHLGIVLRTPREVAQYVGTEVLRSFSAEIHCEEIEKELLANNTYIISDIRFPNEFDYFQRKYKKNFRCFYIQSLQAEMRVLGVDNHSSETQILEIARNSVKIENNSSKATLKKNLIKELKKFLE